MARRLVAGVLPLMVAPLLAACSHAAGGSGAAHLAWVATDASVTVPGVGLTPVDMRSGMVEAKVPVGSLPSAMAFTKGGAGLLVVTQGDDTLHEIDPATRAVVRSVVVGVEPDAVAVAPGGTGGRGVALVANLDSNSVTPVDLGTWRAGAAIAVGTKPVAIAVTVTSTKSATALVVDFGSNQVTPIDVSTLQAGAPISVGLSPGAIGVASGEALVGNFGDHTLTAIDLASLQPSAAVALPVDPTGIAVTPSGAMAYITGGASIVPLTVTGLVVGTPINLPDVAEALALDAASTTVWVALQGGSLVPVSLPAGTVGHRIRLGGHPSAVVISHG